MRNNLYPHLKTRLMLIAVISLLLASALNLYTFGISSGFLINWMRSFFVFFVLIGFTVMAIVPGVNYLISRITGN
ncbi:DUF2798 domain-containing protein [Pontibacter sp. MBLB2868]|uniref:DUF2798 domain-containing protein n=1 Tax=Pontibacter sp. MBLB2868 TaxID=3451555 RepID=UPI003F752284